MGVGNEARRFVVASEEKRAALGVLYQALQKEVPLARKRVNDRKLVPFVIGEVTWSLNTIGRQELKIYAVRLQSRRSKKMLANNVFSRKKQRKLENLLRPAFVEELGMGVVCRSIGVTVSIYGHSKES